MFHLLTKIVHCYISLTNERFFALISRYAKNTEKSDTPEPLFSTHYLTNLSTYY